MRKYTCALLTVMRPGARSGRRKPHSVSTSDATLASGPTSLSGAAMAGRSGVVRGLILLLVLLTALPGCAAFRPLPGIPARSVSHEFHGPPRSGKRTINLSMLRQTPPREYLVDSGDVLGIYIEGILGRREDPPPVHFPLQEEVPPSLGFPLPVRDDGTISLPLIAPIPVRGMTLRQVEEAIRNAYTVDRQFLQPGRDRILVSLQKPRTYQVLVIRQEAGADFGLMAMPGMLNPGATKRGTGHVLKLPAYKNDVLHALAETGGLPGLDAENTIYVIRNNARVPGGLQPAAPHGPAAPPFGGPPLQPAPPSMPALPPPPGPSASLTGSNRYQAAQDADWGHSHTSGVRQVRYETGWGHVSPAQAAAPGAVGPWPPGSFVPPQGPPMLSPSGVPYPPPSGPQFQAGPYVPGPEMHGFDPGWMDGNFDPYAPTMRDRDVLRIPVRLGPGEQVHLTEQDIILGDGDIVFIESRDTEIFYTGGLLGGGQFTLPRDYDLDVLGAIAIAQAQGQMGGSPRSIGGPSSLNNDVTISASDVVILRPMPGGSQLPIRVNLYNALRDPSERVVIQPGDYIILQYTRTEAVCAFFERHLLEGALFGLAASQLHTRR